MKFYMYSCTFITSLKDIQTEFLDHNAILSTKIHSQLPLTIYLATKAYFYITHELKKEITVGL